MYLRQVWCAYGAVEHNVTAFSEPPLDVIKINVKLLTPAVMADNLAVKADECPLNWGR